MGKSHIILSIVNVIKFASITTSLILLAIAYLFHLAEKQKVEKEGKKLRAIRKKL